MAKRKRKKTIASKKQKPITSTTANTSKFIAILVEYNKLDTCLIINASSKPNAYQKFLAYYVPTDDLFKEHVHDYAINDGLTEIFWVDKNGHSLEEMELEQEQKYIYFRENVKKFFGKHKDYAEAYIEYIENSHKALETLESLTVTRETIKKDIERGNFSNEMLTYIAYNLSLNFDWYKITVIPLNEIKEI